MKRIFQNGFPFAVAATLLALATGIVLPAESYGQEKAETEAQPEAEAQPETTNETFAQTKIANRYPVVVIERGASFSFPDTPAQRGTQTSSVSDQAEPPAPFSPKAKYWRTADPILQSASSVLNDFQSSVIKIQHRGEQVALGTVISKQNHVLTKWSLIESLPTEEIRFRCGEQAWQVTLVGFDKLDDLALFVLHSPEHLGEPQLRPVVFSTNGKLPPGKVVISAGVSGKANCLGLTTVPPINLKSNSQCPDCVDMGMTLDPSMLVNRVYPRTVGERLGMLVGDRVVSINNTSLTSLAQYRTIEQNVHVGDSLEVILDRNGQRIRIVDTVPDLTKKTKRDRWGGGPFSQRRFGFSSVIVHDSVVAPTDCGGPLVNLNGQFCGLNIARSMRVASMALPAETVRNFLLRYVDADNLETQR